METLTQAPVQLQLTCRLDGSMSWTMVLGAGNEPRGPQLRDDAAGSPGSLDAVLLGSKVTECFQCLC